MEAPGGEPELVHNSTEEIIELLLGPPGEENIHRSLSLSSEAMGGPENDIDFCARLPDRDDDPPTLARCGERPPSWRAGRSSGFHGGAVVESAR